MVAKSFWPHVGWITGKLSSAGCINTTYFMEEFTELSKPASEEARRARWRVC